MRSDNTLGPALPRLTFVLCWSVVILAPAVCAAANSDSVHPTAVIRVYTEQDIREYLERLQNAGDAFHSAAAISDYLCFALIANPAGFLSVMTEQNAAFLSWLQGLQDRSFTDRGGCIDRHCLRDRMLDTLRAFPAIAPEAPLSSKALAARIVGRLMEITVKEDLS